MNMYDICAEWSLNKDRCVFEGVGTCVDKVSPEICNRHAGVFDLINKVQHYENAENDSWTEIVTYVIGSRQFTLPLFNDPYTNELSIESVRNYVTNIVSQHPEFRNHFGDLLQRMCQLLGVSIINTNNSLTTNWLNDARLLVNGSAASIYESSKLPPLYKILFRYMIPSFLRNTATNNVNICIQNIGLVEKDGKYVFKLLSPSTTLKWINRDSMATPLVLAAIKEIKTTTTNSVFAPINCTNLSP
jgi:hypothetical protein